jgi:hypothetical protein
LVNSNTLLYSGIILGGLVFIFVAINQYQKAKKAEKTWLTAPGVVLNSGVTSHRSRNSKGHTTVSYKPQVSYQYQVKDQTFTSDRLSFGSGSYSQAKAEKKIALYPHGAQVNVHFNPTDPSKSVLETKAASGGIFLTIGIILMVLGAIALFGLP